MQSCPHHAMDGQMIPVPEPKALWVSRELIKRDLEEETAILSTGLIWLLAAYLAASARSPELSFFLFSVTTCIRWELPDPSVGWNSFVKALQFEAVCVCVCCQGVAVEGVFQSFLVLPTSILAYIYFSPTENVSISPRPQTHSYTAVVGCTAVLNLSVCL